MRTQQDLMIMRLVGDMNQAVKRQADDSDSEESVAQITNRGNKLKKKAKFVHEGQLGLPNGPQVYKKTIDYNGFERDIISERPTLFDEEGYEMSSEDDEEGDALATANEFYPYNDVRIEDIMAPLTSVTDLPDHPTLARPFHSKTLTELTTHARLMAQKEKNALWRMKHMLTKLSGDHTWIPTAMMETENDLNFFGDGRAEYRAHMSEKFGMEAENEDVEMNEGQTAETDHIGGQAAVQDEAASDNTKGKQPEDQNAPDDQNSDKVNGRPLSPKTTEPHDVEMGEAQESAAGNAITLDPSDRPQNGEGYKDEPMEEAPKADEQTSNGTSHKDKSPKKGGDATPTAIKPMSAENPGKPAEDIATEAEDPDTTLIDPDAENESGPITKDEAKKDGEAENDDGEEADGEDKDDQPEPRRMRTRAQAQAASDDNARRTRSLSEISNEDFIHPYFLPPVSSIPDRDFMLPPQEAEETRRLLQLYIQKQEEICRGAQKLYMGLLKADMLRKQVMSWARAERHVGEMSDGEDWVDEEEWMLSEPLKKGMDDEEEETIPTGKKTRNRRQ